MELDLSRKPSATPSQRDYIRAASMARGGGSEGDGGSIGTGTPLFRLLLFVCMHSKGAGFRVWGNRDFGCGDSCVIALVMVFWHANLYTCGCVSRVEGPRIQGSWL